MTTYNNNSKAWEDYDKSKKLFLWKITLMIHSVHNTYTSTRSLKLRLIKVKHQDWRVTILANGMPNSNIIDCEQVKV